MEQSHSSHLLVSYKSYFAVETFSTADLSVLADFRFI